MCLKINFVNLFIVLLAIINILNFIIIINKGVSSRLRRLDTPLLSLGAFTRWPYWLLFPSYGPAECEFQEQKLAILEHLKKLSAS